MNTYLAIMHIHIKMNLDNWTTLVLTFRGRLCKRCES
jgi:hypothetical protein